jgi:predicted small secreted protein
MRRFWTALACVMMAAALLTVLGCETTKGMGKDLEHTGDAIQGK